MQTPMQHMLTARYRAQGDCETCGMPSPASPSSKTCETCTELVRPYACIPEIFHLQPPLDRLASLWKQNKSLQGLLLDGIDFTIPRDDLHKRARKSLAALITQTGYKAIDGSRMPSELILRFLIKPGVMLFFIRDNVTDALFGYAEMGRMAIATQGMGRGIKPGTYHKIPISLPTTSFKFAIYSDAGSCYKKCMPTLTRELPTGLAAQANARCAHCTIVASDNRLQSCTKCKNNHCAECISPTCKSCGHSSLGNIKSFMETNMESLKLMPPDAIEQIVAETTHFNSVEDFKKHIHKMTRYIRRRRARRISKKADEQAEEEEEECCICLDNPADIIFQPCLHRIMCTPCSVAITTCPICRASLTK